MIALFDRYMANHPAAADYCRQRLAVWFGMSSLSGMLACIGTALALGIIKSNYDGMLYIAALAVTDIVFVQAFVLAGFLRQWFMGFFGVVFFMLPYALVPVPETDPIYSLNIACIELLKLLTESITGQLGYFRLYGFSASGGAMTICIVLFALGAFVRTAAKKSDFYCRTRLEQLPENDDA